jgi:hypothetical protein
VVKRAANKGMQLHFDRELGNDSPIEWTTEIDQRLAGSGYHREVIFFHRASRALVVTDLIENSE